MALYGFQVVSKEKTKQGVHELFSSIFCVMDKFKESDVVGQLFLRNSSMRSQPRAQQRPETFYCIYVYFTKSIAIIITGIFTSGMTYTLVLVPPLRQSAINAILVREYSSTRNNSSLNQGGDGLLFYILKHLDNNLPPSFNHSKYGRLFFLESSSSSCSFQTVSSPFTAFFLTAPGFPLWPATTYTSSHSTSAPNVTLGFRRTTPSRSQLVI